MCSIEGISLTLLRISSICKYTFPILLIFSIFSAINWSSYTIVCLVYLLLDGIHVMISEFRYAAYHGLISSPVLYNLVPGSIIGVDKLFNRTHVAWCMTLGLLKAGLSVFQIYQSTEYLQLVIFYFGLLVSLLAVLYEIIMLFVILNTMEAEYLSTHIGIHLELGDQETPGCGMARHVFVVVDDGILEV